MSGIRTYERIQIGDTAQDICVKLSEGNPGALSVCIRLWKEGVEVELGTPLGVLQTFLALDSAAVFGPKLWLLYNDVCGRDLARLLVIMRAFDFGIISAARLHLELQDRGGIDHELLAAEVRKRCPGFGERKVMPNH